MCPLKYDLYGGAVRSFSPQLLSVLASINFRRIRGGRFASGRILRFRNNRVRAVWSPAVNRYISCEVVLLIKHDTVVSVCRPHVWTYTVTRLRINDLLYRNRYINSPVMNVLERLSPWVCRQSDVGIWELFPNSGGASVSIPPILGIHCRPDCWKMHKCLYILNAVRCPWTYVGLRP